MTEPDGPLIEMPMFPLGSVLYPRGTLPLHIFELRYQQLLNHAPEADRRFGVVLISRGSEVGGGEVRTEVGTIAGIDEYQRFDDGRAAVIATGAERFEVVEWLEDAPYPRARIRVLGSEAEGPHDQELFDAARVRFERLLELGERLGRLESVPESDWSGDLETATWQLAGRSPCTALDQYAILSAPSRAQRLAKIDELLHEVYVDLELMGGLDSSG